MYVDQGRGYKLAAHHFFYLRSGFRPPLPSSARLEGWDGLYYTTHTRENKISIARGAVIKVHISNDLQQFEVLDLELGQHFSCINQGPLHLELLSTLFIRSVLLLRLYSAAAVYRRRSMPRLLQLTRCHDNDQVT